MSAKLLPLNARQLAFCAEYIVDANGTQAYLRAGYAKKGARTGACKLLALPHIQAHIEQLNLARTKRKDFNAAWLREEMRELYDIVKDAPLPGDRGVAAGLLRHMSMIEGMVTSKHEFRDNGKLSIQIKTSRKPRK